MTNKYIKYSFRGANQDVSKSKHPVEFYYEGQHIRITATNTQSTGSISNEKGNELILTLPDISINTSSSTIVYGEKTLSYRNGSEIDQQLSNGELPSSSTSQIIIGHTNTRTGIVLFTTDDNGMDCIWHLDGILDDTYDLKLLYVRNIGFSSEHLIQALYNYENENIQKVYWVNGIHQVRFINITHDQIEGNDALINVPSNNINFVGEIDFSQPIIENIIGGGTHTAGMIQYAYNLYRLNASQTKISPLSELVPLDKGASGGGEVDEVVGAIPIIRIDDIDTSYTHIKVYAIKYTSYNQIPSVNLIDEREIGEQTSITVYDNGSTISSLSLEEFLFIGSDPLVPKHIEAKDNILFPANIQSREFVLPDELDCRAYGFLPNSSSTVVYNKDGNSVTVNSSNYNLDYKHDAINKDISTRIYQANSTILGGEGKFLKYQLVQKSLSSPEDYRLFKDQEIYRIAIQFYNRLGQKSLPRWIGDFRAPEGNLEGNYNTLRVDLKPEFFTWLNTFSFESEDDKPVGFKILRANRTINDRTVICQGIISGMMCNIPVGPNGRGYNSYSETEQSDMSSRHPKYPNVLLRTQQNIVPLQPNEHLLNMQFVDNDPVEDHGGQSGSPLTELQFDGENRLFLSFQYTVMQQMYSPEVMFDNLSFSTGLKVRVKGGVLNTRNEAWLQEIRTDSQTIEVEGKVVNGITPHDSSATRTSIKGNVNDLLDRGVFSNPHGSTDSRDLTAFNQWYRVFGSYKRGNIQPEKTIYGSPEITERGQGRTIYNNNSKYEYTNTFEGIGTDGNSSRESLPLISLNSFGAKCLTMVLDFPNSDPDPRNRSKIEDLYASAQINDPSAALVLEVIKDQNNAIGTIYNGNSYEDKRRTEYLEIGEYKDLDTNFVQIDSPGDTYVQKFRFLRASKTDTEVYDTQINQFTEVVEFPVETTVDLKNRNDISLSTWDSRFQPQYEDYHKYNRVYSQQPTLITSTDVDFTFRRVENFDTRIQASRTKIPNETIDSWTDILPNEVMDLNGKYGPLNNIVSFEDNIYAFQDEAIAAISINPRVQVQGSDGVAIELGTGGILYDFNYITTKSGSINKWGIIPTKFGIYYYDALNRAVGRVPDYSKAFLTDVKGLHTFFNNNHIYDDIKIDNPVLRKGALLGYDNNNNDVYITLLQGEKSFSWVFNEAADYFIDRKLYFPSGYIYKGEKLLVTHPDNNKLYEQFKGEYNKFFDIYHPSYVILQVNPESDITCVFNNIQYASEVYLNDIDQPDKTLTHIHAYNEYQDSGRIPLIVGRDSNIRRKFREWRANIPRDGRNRIRNPWMFLKLELDNESNYKMILHDIILSYSV